MRLRALHYRLHKFTYWGITVWYCKKHISMTHKWHDSYSHIHKMRCVSTTSLSLDQIFCPLVTLHFWLRNHYVTQVVLGCSMRCHAERTPQICIKLQCKLNWLFAINLDFILCHVHLWFMLICWRSQPIRTLVRSIQNNEFI